MDVAIKAAALGAAAAIAALLIKKSNPEIAFLLAVAVIACMTTAVLKLAIALKEVIDAAQTMSGLSSAVFVPVIKCVGVGITGKICADLCRDASQSAIASTVEFVASVAALYVSLPLITTLMKMIGGMI